VSYLNHWLSWKSITEKNTHNKRKFNINSINNS
jgi:hypothetical protein